MKAFADLIDALIITPSRNRKLDLMANYFRSTPDPDRGYTLAVLTGQLTFSHAKSSAFRDLVLQKVDPTLFAISYDYVGDLAETVALIWPKPLGIPNVSLPTITELVETLNQTKKVEVPSLLASWFNVANETERWAMIKLVTGNLRIGVSERLAKQALAQFSGAVAVEEIEEIWHGLQAPYTDLFHWLEGHAERPTPDNSLTFRPLMLAHPSDDLDKSIFTPDDFAAEWKWDGVRVQLVGDGEDVRLYSRTGEDITRAFPDLLAGQKIHAVLDGELLVGREGQVASFNELQQRLNRKAPTAALMEQYPAHLRLYDLLFEGEEDLRPLGFMERRRRLDAWFETHRPPRFDVSPLVDFSTYEELGKVQAEGRAGVLGAEIEGYMLKRKDAPYIAGRPKGYWYKWKRDPLVADLVLMYAQRGHGKRSSFYSDFTFGAWMDGDEGAAMLVPVAKAYSGYTDEELVKIDKWIRAHTTHRFGPVREVKQELVFELGFDSIAYSNRHKSGVATRFPRILRLRFDKPPQEAARLDDLKKLITSSVPEDASLRA